MHARLLPVCVSILPLLLIGQVRAQPVTAYGTVKLEKLPFSGDVLMARAIRKGLISIKKGQPASSGPQAALTCGPAPCVLPNVAASGANPVDETPIASNPANANELLSGGNDYSCIGPGGYPAPGFYFSTDAGSTWSATCGQINSAWYQSVGDPIVGFNANGDAFAGGINADSSLATSAIVVSKSKNHGATWSKPVVAVINVGGGFADKPWMEIDTGAASPHQNAIYISATQFEPGGSQISVSHSATGGKGTWTTVLVSSLGTGSTVNQFSDLAIGADGAVYVSWLQCHATSSASDCGGTTGKMFVSKSIDGGTTWSTPAMIHKVALAPDGCGCAYYGSLPNTSERISDIPAIAVDNSTSATAGKLYVTDYTWTGTQMKVEVASSTNGGANWSKAKFVAPARYVQDQFFPWLNVSDSGLVGVTWLDRRMDASNVNYDAYGAVSNDGGHTYPNTRISSVSSNPFNDGFSGAFMGDYTGNAWDGTSLFQAWTDTRGGSASQDEVGGILEP